MGFIGDEVLDSARTKDHIANLLDLIEAAEATYSEAALSQAKLLPIDVGIRTL